MGAKDVGSAKDGGDIGRCGGVEASFSGRRGRFIQESEHLAQEAFAGGSGEDRQTELMKLVEVGQERVIFVEPFAEAETGIEDDFVAWNSRDGRGFDALAEADEDEGENFDRRDRRLRGPVLRSAPGMHQDGAAAQFRAGIGHGGIPEMAADVVDNLGPGLDCERGGGGMVGVDGEDGLGLLFQNGLDDGEDARLFFFGGQRVGVGTGGFAAHVEDVCAFIEHLEGLGERPSGSMLGGVEMSAVGKAVRGDVENAHDEGSLPQREAPGAEMPVEAGAICEGHKRSLDAGWRIRVLDCADDKDS